jgi:hypothetical protein
MSDKQRKLIICWLVGKLPYLAFMLIVHSIWDYSKHFAMEMMRKVINNALGEEKATTYEWIVLIGSLIIFCIVYLSHLTSDLYDQELS